MSTPISCPIHANLITKFIMTKEQLREHGFPVIEKGSVTIKPNKYQLGKEMYYQPEDRLRKCLRCQTMFMVEESGHQTVQDHTVCSTSHGLFNFHIHDQQPAGNLKKFHRTKTAFYQLPIMALDVEMVYTTIGQEVGRVTLVNHLGDSLVNTVVLPANPIIDYVTQFSGLTEQSFVGVTTTLDQVKAALLMFIDQKSVLVGHGLNGDLRALRLVHYNVIDTSIMFQIGTEGRRPSLKALTKRYLGSSIQQHSDGHCSEEDAKASLQLVFYSVTKIFEKEKKMMEYQMHQMQQQMHNH